MNAVLRLALFLSFTMDEDNIGLTEPHGMRKEASVMGQKPH